MTPDPTSAIRSDVSMTPTAEVSARKPRLAFAIATGLGLGYLPKAPGTWGSLGGVLLACGALVSSGWRFDTPVAGPTPATANTAADIAARFIRTECLLVL